MDIHKNLSVKILRVITKEIYSEINIDITNTNNIRDAFLTLIDGDNNEME